MEKETRAIIVMRAKETKKQKFLNALKRYWLSFKHKHGKKVLPVLLILSGLFNVYSFVSNGGSLLIDTASTAAVNSKFEHVKEAKKEVMVKKASLRNENMKVKKTVDDYVIQDRHKGRLTKSFVYLANEMYIKHGVPVEIILAQLILESSWGKAGMAKEAHNYFGHKHYTKSGDGILPEPYMAKDDCGGKDCKFQRYESKWWAFHYHCSRVLKRYMNKRKGNNLVDYTECLCAKKNKLGKGSMNYATACEYKDPYDKRIMKLIQDENLSFYYQP